MSRKRKSIGNLANMEQDKMFWDWAGRMKKWYRRSTSADAEAQDMANPSTLHQTK